MADEIVAQGVIPEEALAYWRDNAPVSADMLKTLDAAARKRAFSAAGLAKEDMLRDLHASLEEAMRIGEPFAEWKKRIPEILEHTGWTGQRLETIYRTNVQTAYSAGRYAQMQEAVKTRPYWMYVAVEDDRTRPDHWALSGLVYPADHVFWASYYPPNGYRCRCVVVSVSQRQVERRGLEVQTEIRKHREYIDNDGFTQMAVNIGPDRGFDSNPAADWLAGRFTPDR